MEIKIRFQFLNIFFAKLYLNKKVPNQEGTDFDLEYDFTFCPFNVRRKRSNNKVTKRVAINPTQQRKIGKQNHELLVKL